ncbi:MAG: hypothetical protein IPO15_16835 [Anaerolineae bacterium]|uniref:hypothetical protein n=1 Tax=Candidatus Amarolinea dominans TaxID=3140696 RepID=UPI003135A2E3|nr:hypothetical protein [Anaerolineae bacterium]
MAQLQAAGRVPLLDFIGGKPYRGILTGLNEAFIDGPRQHATSLVFADPSAAELIRPYLRGQDIKRWHPEWASLWMILLKSSENFDWPWSKSGESAEAIFAHAFPSLHAYLKPHEGALRKRQDQGRFWWELRSCDYYSAFEATKTILPGVHWSNSVLGITALVCQTNDSGLLASRLPCGPPGVCYRQGQVRLMLLAPSHYLSSP